MNEMSSSDQFQYSYMSTLVINPLGAIMKALSLRQYGQALDFMEVFILSIHKASCKLKLRPWVEKIHVFKNRLMGTQASDPFVNWASLESDRREIFDQEGPALALQLYEEINRVLAEEKYFIHMDGIWIDNVKFTDEDTQGQDEDDQ
jgi:hypothetical protein